MSRRITVTVIAAAALVAPLLTATTAQAYDSSGYAYAAGHMISASDIPAAAGSYRKNPAFNAYPNSSASVLCDVPAADPSVPDTMVQYPGPAFTYSVNYQGKGTTDAPSISVVVAKYASTQKAIKAFRLASKRIVACTGTGSDTWKDTETGETHTFSTQVTHGLVPAVTTAGVESLFVSTDSLDQSTPGDSQFVNDQYAVTSLIDDVIITTTYYANTNANPTTKQLKAVNQVAFNAESAWLNG